MKSIYEVLGENIRSLRKARGWSQAVLAEKADLAVSYITMIELGQRSASLEVVQNIARVFDIPVAGLFEGESLNETPENSDTALDRFQKQLEMKIKVAIDESMQHLRSQGE